MVNFPAYTVAVCLTMFQMKMSLSGDGNCVRSYRSQLAPGVTNEVTMGVQVNRSNVDMLLLLLQESPQVSDVSIVCDFSIVCMLRIICIPIFYLYCFSMAAWSQLQEFFSTHYFLITISLSAEGVAIRSQCHNIFLWYQQLKFYVSKLSMIKEEHTSQIGSNNKMLA